MAKQRENGIVWTSETVNITRGCSLDSDGCKNCYAMAMAGRFCGPRMPYEGLVTKTSQGYKWNGKIKLVPAMLTDLLRKTKPRTVFIDSMSDLFHDAVPDAYLDKFFAVAALTGRNTYQLLTKRAERARDYLQRLPRRYMDVAGALLNDADLCPFPRDSNKWHDADHDIQIAIAAGPLPNVHMGVSAENQAMANRRIVALLDTPAVLRWVSVEPMLGPIDLTRLDPAIYAASVNALTGKWTWEGGPTRAESAAIDWVVVGGESGPDARPMHPAWLRALQEQCADAGVAFLFKQWGAWVAGTGSKTGFTYLQNGVNTCGDKDTFEWGDGIVSQNVGKKAAGRLLDGMQYDEYPTMLKAA